MSVVIKELEKRDHKKAIEFAKQGMHFSQYTDKPLELRIYANYFFYSEMQRTTRLLAAYMGDSLVGVLMADMKGEAKIKCPLRKRIFVKIVDLFMRSGGADDTSLYDKANAEMLEIFSKQERLDGEICFLAADPSVQGKRVGSLLLEELSRREKGKRIYLYTDDNCTYQFYEHRGFTRCGEKEIEMVIHEKKIPLACFLYSKEL